MLHGSADEQENTVSTEGSVRKRNDKIDCFSLVKPRKAYKF